MSNSLSDHIISLSIDPICEFSDDGPPSIQVNFYTGSNRRFTEWLSLKPERGTFVAVCNTHMMIEARRDCALASALRQADFAICDGQPIAWLLGSLTGRKVSRITGPEIFERIINERLSTLRVALVGGDKETHRRLLASALRRCRDNLLLIDPGRVADGDGPSAATIERLKAFDPGVVFVGLGCPKQEKWIAQASQHVAAHFLGVGAAFDYRIGRIQRAPIAMQRCGGEWLYRAVQQPRLVRRYASTILPFAKVFASALIPRVGSGGVRLAAVSSMVADAGDSVLAITENSVDFPPR